MSKVLLSLLILLAVSAVFSASAPAAECKKEVGAKKFALCLGAAKTLTEGTKFDVDIATGGSTN
jgi:hypothetical protein